MADRSPNQGGELLSREELEQQERTRARRAVRNARMRERARIRARQRREIELQDRERELQDIYLALYPYEPGENQREHNTHRFRIRRPHPTRENGDNYMSKFRRFMNTDSGRDVQKFARYWAKQRTRLRVMHPRRRNKSKLRPLEEDLLSIHSRNRSEQSYNRLNVIYDEIHTEETMAILYGFFHNLISHHPEETATLEMAAALGDNGRFVQTRQHLLSPPGGELDNNTIEMYRRHRGLTRNPPPLPTEDELARVSEMLEDESKGEEKPKEGK